MPSSTSASNDGVQCWVAIGDVEIRRQSFTARRATPAYFLTPLAEEVPRKVIPDLIADIREGLEEVFGRPNCPAPFIPRYPNKDDAIARAKLLRSLGREGSDIIRVRLARCEPRIGYRLLENYAEDVGYKVAEVTIPAKKVLIICGPFTKGNIVGQLQVLN
ncbi:hypothetical protein GQ44DRAFT_780260 [Phaeosphaeriaceae sp. PMI808]|nr:hypothetical protein GQ44DRAFT_780260 [Phaeosphaeriaceae sp. PMI808]